MHRSVQHSSCIATAIKCSALVDIKFVNCKRITATMSAAEVNRIFKSIEKQYLAAGIIDSHQKEMLFEAMKQFGGGDGFIGRISEAFKKLDSEDVDNDEQNGTIEEPTLMDPIAGTKSFSDNKPTSAIGFLEVDLQPPPPPLPPKPRLGIFSDDSRKQQTLQYIPAAGYVNCKAMNTDESETDLEDAGRPTMVQKHDDSNEPSGTMFLETQLQPPPPRPPKSYSGILSNSCRNQQIPRYSCVDFVKVRAGPALPRKSPNDIQLQPKQSSNDADRKREKRKLNFNMVMEVFYLFQFSCVVEKTEDKDY